MSIILLRGFSNSGKDFIGEILCNQYNYTRHAFADSLKKMVAKQFNCNIDILHSQEGKLQICQRDSLKRTYRQILIDEALRLRNIDSDIFAKHCCKEIKHDKVVITDWRYPNEIQNIIDTFPNYKIIPVHVQRMNQIQSPVVNISEYHLIDRQNDFVIINNMDKTIYKEVEKLIIFIYRNEL